MYLFTEPHVLAPLAWASEFRARPVHGGGYQVELPPLHKFGTGLGVDIREVDVRRLEHLLSEYTVRSRFPESSGRSDFVFDIASNLSMLCYALLLLAHHACLRLSTCNAHTHGRLDVFLETSHFIEKKGRSQPPTRLTLPTEIDTRQRFKRRTGIGWERTVVFPTDRN